ncbi:MAG: PGPGW domain-containing protein [Gammaproteobacteria bacterium]
MATALKWIRRIAIAIAGFTVLCVGVAMIVLPGPAFIVIPAGLGILALEFAWAKRWLTEAKVRGSGILQTIRGRSGR